MGGDEVNSIEDTFEASQVAEIIKTTYFAMMSNRNWPHQRKLVQLTASGNPSLPTHMTMGDEVKEVISVKYNVSTSSKKEYRDVKWKDPEDFLRLVHNRNSDASNVEVIIDPSGSELLIVNDSGPTYFTSFDDVTIVFDAYDSNVDTTLQESKIVVMAFVMSSWEHVDDHVPDLPSEAFTALLESAKSASFLRVAQRADQTSAMEAQRQQTWLARKAWRAGGGIQYPSYGRGRIRKIDPTFRYNS